MSSDFLRLPVVLINKYVPTELQPLLDDPQCHNTTWHEYSLMEHGILVFEAARRLYLLTGVDVLVAAWFHDLGKIEQFAEAVRTGDFKFIGHEKLSAGIAMRAGLSEMSQFLIRHHDISYNHKADRVVKVLCFDDQNLLKKLLVLATADTVGKGWTEAQRKQRPEVAEKFQEICSLAGFPVEFSQTLTTAIM